MTQHSVFNCLQLARGVFAWSCDWEKHLVDWLQGTPGTVQDQPELVKARRCILSRSGK